MTDEPTTVLHDTTEAELERLRARLDQLERPDPTIERAVAQAEDRARRMIGKRERQAEGGRRSRLLRAQRRVDGQLGKIEAAIAGLPDVLDALAAAEAESGPVDTSVIEARLGLSILELQALADVKTALAEGAGRHEAEMAEHRQRQSDAEARTERLAAKYRARQEAGEVRLTIGASDSEPMAEDESDHEPDHLAHKRERASRKRNRKGARA